MSEHSNSQIERLIDMTLKSINDADSQAATARVQRLQDEQSLAGEGALDSAQLIEHLIKQKTMQAGMVGAATSGAAFIPGLGTLATLTLGVATDVGLTLKMQSDLVLEIAAAHGHALTDTERRNAMMLVTGANLGSERLVNQASRRLARKVSQRFAGRAFVKVIPFVGVAASAGANMVTTYAIGRRADAYFGLAPEVSGDIDESVRALTGLDERKLVEWLGELMGELSQLLGVGARRAGQSAAHFGRATSDTFVSGLNALRDRRQQRRQRRNLT